MAGLMELPNGERLVVLAGGRAIESAPSSADDRVYFLSVDTMTVQNGPELPGGIYG